MMRQLAIEVRSANTARSVRLLGHAQYLLLVLALMNFSIGSAFLSPGGETQEIVGMIFMLVSTLFFAGALAVWALEKVRFTRYVQSTSVIPLANTTVER